MFNRLFGFVAFLVVAVCLGTAAPAHAAQHATTALVAKATADIPMFNSEAAAQAHCPSDTVVWLNTKSGVYHEKGMRWYGRTKHGAYVCKKEADAAGYRDTRNGQ
jgi:hypothetical protein